MADASIIEHDQDLVELLQGDAWVSVNALFNRSSFESKDKFNEWLQRLKNKGQVRIRTGQFGLEVGLHGTPEPSGVRADAKAPCAPAGAGPMPPTLTGPAPLLEAPVRIPKFVVSSLETAGQQRAASAQPSAAAAEPHSNAAPGPAAPAAPAATAETPQAAPEPSPIKSVPPARVEEAPMPKTSTKTADDMRDQVLGLLRQSPWKTGELMKATGMSRSQLYPILEKLRKDKLAHLEGIARAATWSAAGGGKPGAIAAAEKVNKAAKGGRKGGTSTVSDALKQLEQQLRPRVIERLEVKVQVLDRLAAIVDPTIAAVLAEIRGDLLPHESML